MILTHDGSYFLTPCCLDLYVFDWKVFGDGVV